MILQETYKRYFVKVMIIPIIEKECKSVSFNDNDIKTVMSNLEKSILNITAPYIACKGDPIANLQEDLAAEQKARATYEKLINLCRDNPDVVDPLRYLREREVVHFQRFGEALRGVQDKLSEKKFYMHDMKPINKDCNCR